MATPKQITFLESLHKAAQSAGDSGLPEQMLARLADLDHDAVQRWISHLQDRIPVTEKQLALIFKFHGGLANIDAGQEAEFRAMRRNVAREYVDRIINDPHAKKKISDARWDKERAKRAETAEARATRSIERDAEHAIRSEVEQKDWKAQQAESVAGTPEMDLSTEAVPDDLLVDLLVDL